MRPAVPDILQAARVIRGPHASDPSWGFYGKFFLRKRDVVICIVASGADADDEVAQGWEHVSVSTAARCPTWEEMCEVKNLFWTEEETVVQFHPPRSEYVNNHPYCLHLWKPPYTVILPPSIMVGVKSLGTLVR